MPKVPKHSLVSRLPHGSGLALKQQSSKNLADSAILVKMLAAGVCGTDLAILSGARPGGAAVLGHEGVGIVLHAPKSSPVSKGARVIINPVHRQHPHRVIGHSYDGVFRELFCVDAAQSSAENLLVSCPRDCPLEDAELVLAEPLASVLYSLELLREKCGDCSLLIRGSGTVAILAAKLWPRLTGSFAVLASKSEAHARWLHVSASWPAKARLCSVTKLNDATRDCPGGAAFNAAILCCSRENAPEGLRCLLDVVPEGATIDLMAGFPAEYREARLDGVKLDGIRWNNICGVNDAPPTPVVDLASGKTIHLIGHRGTAKNHILQAVELLSRKVISIADIPHRLLTLQQLPKAVNRMLSPKTRRNTKWVKAIVTFS